MQCWKLTSTSSFVFISVTVGVLMELFRASLHEMTPAFVLVYI